MPNNPKLGALPISAALSADAINLTDTIDVSDPSQGDPAEADANQRLPADPRLVTRGSFCGSDEPPLVSAADTGITAILLAERHDADDAESGTKRPAGSRDRSLCTAASLDDLLSGFFFDWFAFTLPHPQTGKGTGGGRGTEVGWQGTHLLVRFALECGLHVSGDKVKGGMNGYGAAVHITASAFSKETVATVLSGHSTNMPGIFFPGGNGQCSSLVVKAKRSFSRILVSRADVALDYSQPLLFESLYDLAQLMAAEKNMKAPQYIESDTGRTFYLGSDRVKLKVYEKDKERLAKGRIRPEDVDPNLVRIEFSFAPSSRRKAPFAKLSPGDMVRSSVWARHFVERAAQLIGVAATGDRIAPCRVTSELQLRTLETSVNYGINQYAKSFARLASYQLVTEVFDGNYSKAKLDRREIEERAIEIFSNKFRETNAADHVLTAEALRETWSIEERAAEIAWQLEGEAGARQMEKDMDTSDLQQIIMLRTRDAKPAPG